MTWRKTTVLASLEVGECGKPWLFTFCHVISGALLEDFVKKPSWDNTNGKIHTVLRVFSCWHHGSFIKHKWVFEQPHHQINMWHSDSWGITPKFVMVACVHSLKHLIHHMTCPHPAKRKILSMKWQESCHDGNKSWIDTTTNDWWSAAFKHCCSTRETRSWPPNLTAVGSFLTAGRVTASMSCARRRINQISWWTTNTHLDCRTRGNTLLNRRSYCYTFASFEHQIVPHNQSFPLNALRASWLRVSLSYWEKDLSLYQFQ